MTTQLNQSDIFSMFSAQSQAFLGTLIAKEAIADTFVKSRSNHDSTQMPRSTPYVANSLAGR